MLLKSKSLWKLLNDIKSNPGSYQKPVQDAAANIESRHELIGSTVFQRSRIVREQSRVLVQYGVLDPEYNLDVRS